MEIYRHGGLHSLCAWKEQCQVAGRNFPNKDLVVLDEKDGERGTKVSKVPKVLSLAILL